MKVKGTAIVDLVRIVRAQKGIDWGKYLKPEDLKIVNSLIVATEWYPGDSFWRIAYAVAKEVGQMNSENQFLFGRLSAQSYLRVYKRILVEGDPAASLERCVDLWESFYDFEGAPFKKTEIEKGPGWIKLTAYDYPDMIIPEMRVPYFSGLTGYFQEIAEQAFGRDIKSTVEDKGNRFEMTFNWGWTG